MVASRREGRQGLHVVHRWLQGHTAELGPHINLADSLAAIEADCICEPSPNSCSKSSPVLCNLTYTYTMSLAP